MTLAQLNDIYSRSGPTADEQRVIVEYLNLHRFEFGVKELPEIKPPALCCWISRRTKLPSHEHAAQNSLNYYKQQIKHWINLIESYEASLSLSEKAKRFVGKHKWLYSMSAMIIGSIGAIWNGYDMVAQWFWPPY